MRDALAKPLLIHGPDGLTASRQAVAVSTMRTGDVVSQVQGAARSHGSAFLAYRDVRRPPVIEILDRLVGAGAELHDHLLHLADHQHVFEEIGGRLRFNAARLELASQISLETITLNLAAIDLEGPEIRPQIAQVTYTHFCTPQGSRESRIESTNPSHSTFGSRLSTHSQLSTSVASFHEVERRKAIRLVSSTLDSLSTLDSRLSTALMPLPPPRHPCGVGW